MKTISEYKVILVPREQEFTVDAFQGAETELPKELFLY